MDYYIINVSLCPTMYECGLDDRISSTVRKSGENENVFIAGDFNGHIRSNAED